MGGESSDQGTGQQPWFGLAEGTPAPDMELRSLGGGYRRVWDRRGRRFLLIFIQPECPHSRSLLPVIAGLLTDPPGNAPLPVIISMGSESSNRRLVETYGIRVPVFLQDDMEARLEFRVQETPAGCMIDETGRIAGLFGIGATGILSQMGVTPGPGWGSDTSEFTSVGDRFRQLLEEQQARGTLDVVHPEAARQEMRKRGSESLPLISVIMATRNRPEFLAHALECYRRQTYPLRELIVVDDDDSTLPADEEAILPLGRLIRVREGTTLGAKFNRGVVEARGLLCQKWDDDDWYAPTFLETMVSAFLAHAPSRRGRSAVAYQILAQWLDLERWRVLDPPPPSDNPSGGTLLFAREDWEHHPFRDFRRSADFWFLVDQLAAGVPALPIRSMDTFMYVRHRPHPHATAHIWTRWDMDRGLDDYLGTISSGYAAPETVLPAWALATYRDLREAQQSMAAPNAGRAGSRA